jgi:signal transduction histidine kinase
MHHKPRVEQPGHQHSLWLHDLWKRFQGPRFIDLPVRVAVIVYGVFGILPIGMESTEPLYITRWFLEGLLIVAAPFLPLTVASIAWIGAIASEVLLPDFLNTLPEAMMIAIAVLASYKRWAAAAVATVGLLGFYTFANLRGSISSGQMELMLSAYNYVVIVGLGLAALVAERRIEKEVENRISAEAEHERRLAHVRQQFVLDTHDTVSHALTETIALTTMLTRQVKEQSALRTIAVLAMTSRIAQQDLRRLLLRLRSQGTAPDTESVDLTEQLRTIGAKIATSARTVGITLDVGVDDLKMQLRGADANHIVAILKELATNILRYAQPGVESTIRVLRSPAAPGTVVLESVNLPAGALPDRAPRSIGERADLLGGFCLISADETGRFVVHVELPLSAEFGRKG